MFRLEHDAYFCSDKPLDNIHVDSVAIVMSFDLLHYSYSIEMTTHFNMLVYDMPLCDVPVYFNAGLRTADMHAPPPRR